MREDLLKQLVEKTFAKIACPLQGNGVYAEIQQAILAAYNMGKRKEESLEQLLIASATEG